MPAVKTILLIAATDPTSGAGITADVRTAWCAGLYPLCAITAVTVQNSHGLKQLNSVGEKVIYDQMEAIMEDVAPDCVKIGMLPDAAAVCTVAKFLNQHHLKNIICDPILAPTSGQQFTDDNYIRALVKELLPITDLATPNRKEYQQLREAGLKEYDVNILITDGETVDDNIHNCALLKTPENGEQIIDICNRKVNTVNHHGTGCMLSTLIACNLAKNMSLPDAIKSASESVGKSLEAGKHLCLGHSSYGPSFLVNQPLI